MQGSERPQAPDAPRLPRVYNSSKQHPMAPKTAWTLSPDRCFDPQPDQRRLARRLYEGICSQPILSPHTHIDPALLAEPSASLGNPVDVFVRLDHYVTRMLHSQGIPPESLGVSPQDGTQAEQDERRIWQLFAENFHLFRGTPSGLWLTHQLVELFGLPQRLDGATAQDAYDQISERLASPEFQPRRLFERFKIEALATTDAATDSLRHHRKIRASGWSGRILPTFRPDALLDLESLRWRADIDQLSQASDVTVKDYTSYIRALEARRKFFKAMGAAATDHAAQTPHTAELSRREAEAIFQRALQGRSEPADAARFGAHMLMQMARMSTEDGLVMQLHPGALRNHDIALYERFGPDQGGDIPLQTEFTRGLRPLLSKFGTHPRLTLILFTLDESAYARELAPLAGHYPALKLGPPWWFHDSLNGMRRYFDRVIETAGLQNTAGFNDDSRSLCAIPARHDLWRRASANWLAGLVVRHLLDLDEAEEMALDMAAGLARRAYRL
jgi:glucuronate isomerase